MRRLLVLLAATMAGLLAIGAGSALACPGNPGADAAAARALQAIDVTDLTGGDPFYYTSGLTPRPTTTHSKVPHLPVFSGFMQTNNTYRFVSVAEQVFTMIGEGKHGLWRIQDNGTIREYLKAGKTGLPAGANLWDPKNQAILHSDYSHFIPEESFGGYKDPFVPVNAKGNLNFVDLPINHPKYGGKYDDHVAIDLPHWYCTMSENEYPNAKKAVQFAFAQPGANVVGPLGKRAGLDIEELYTNVVRLTPFPDARIWVNTGSATDIRWEAVDVAKTNAEFYLYERPFFNVPYLFVTVVMDNVGNGDFRYVRPYGAYWDHLKSRGHRKLDSRGLKHRKQHGGHLKTTVTLAPRVYVEGGGLKQIAGTQLYGLHHPNRPAEFGESGGGACPMKGGDWDGYPDTKGGAGWPTQYEEITPVCDGVVVDIKFYANLDGADWNDATKYLANAGAGTKQVTYTVKPGFYGAFVDPYHTGRKVTNPEAAQIGPTIVVTFPTVRAAVGYTPVGTVFKK